MIPKPLRTGSPDDQMPIGQRYRTPNTFGLGPRLGRGATLGSLQIAPKPHRGASPISLHLQFHDLRRQSLPPSAATCYRHLPLEPNSSPTPTACPKHKNKVQQAAPINAMSRGLPHSPATRDSPFTLHLQHHDVSRQSLLPTTAIRYQHYHFEPYTTARLLLLA
ncbi:hypothetical protein U1Q18_021822 [Sarracenia purpurea var. burkii]